MTFTLLLASSYFCGLNTRPRFVSAAEYSGTDVGGPITINTTWTLSGSPYVVSADILVVADVFLTIEAATTVKFGNGASIIVDGTLVAKGNSSSLITFTSNASSPAPGDWGSIRTRTGGAISDLDWAIIEYSEQGIETMSHSNISHCTFRRNNIAVSGANASITHCTFENNFISINATDSSITDSEFYNNTDAVTGTGNVENCRIYNNSRNGISGIYFSANGINDYIYFGPVVNCSIHDNGGNGTSATSVTDSSIYNNEGSGVSAFSVADCSVYGNGERGITANSSVNNTASSTETTETESSAENSGVTQLQLRTVQFTAMAEMVSQPIQLSAAKSTTTTEQEFRQLSSPIAQSAETVGTAYSPPRSLVPRFLTTRK